MTWTYDVATDVGKVRLLISDTDTTRQFFSDEEIEVFMELAGGTVRLGAAQALEAIAANETLVQKRIKLLDLSTDGPAVAAELRKLASTYRCQEHASAFASAAMAEGQFGRRERLRKQALRQGL